MNVRELYRPYLPAFTTFFGAILVAVGFFIGQFGNLEIAAQWLRLIGSLLAAFGAFWSVHRQVKSSAENKDLTTRIVSLSEKLDGYVTGGDSFCYGYPMFNLGAANAFNWIFVHKGQYPLSDVSVRIANLHRDENNPNDISRLIGNNFDLGTVFPGRAHHHAHQEVRRANGRFNLFFLSKNGSWTQEIRWHDTSDGLFVANRVIKDGSKLDSPLLLEISEKYPESLPLNEAWN